MIKAKKVLQDEVYRLEEEKRVILVQNTRQVRENVDLKSTITSLVAKQNLLRADRAILIRRVGELTLELAKLEADSEAES